jgi:hypothetical protein
MYGASRNKQLFTHFGVGEAGIVYQLLDDLQIQFVNIQIRGHFGGFK